MYPPLRYIQDTFRIHSRYHAFILACISDTNTGSAVAADDFPFPDPRRWSRQGQVRRRARGFGSCGGVASLEYNWVGRRVHCMACGPWRCARHGVQISLTAAPRSHRSFSRASRPRRACVAESVQILGSFVNSVGFPYGVFESEFQVEVDQRRSSR